MLRRRCGVAAAVWRVGVAWRAAATLPPSGDAAAQPARPRTASAKSDGDAKSEPSDGDRGHGFLAALTSRAAGMVERACDRFEAGLHGMEKKVGFVRRGTVISQKEEAPLAAAAAAAAEELRKRSEVRVKLTPEAAAAAAAAAKAAARKPQRVHAVGGSQSGAKVSKVRSIIDGLGRDREERDRREPFRLWEYLKKTEWKVALSFFLLWQALALVVVPMRTGASDFLEAVTMSVERQEKMDAERQEEAAKAHRELLARELRVKAQAAAKSKAELALVEAHANQRVAELEAELRRRGVTPVTQRT